MANSSEVAFARKTSPVSNQWVASLAPGFTGLPYYCLLVVDPTITDRPNAAYFKFVDGDRSGKPIGKVQTRVNPSPNGKVPNMWIDFPELPLSIWCEETFWTVAQNDNGTAGVREYEF